MERMAPLHTLSAIFICAFLTSASGQQSIVSTNTATVSGAFTVSCDASSVVIPESYLGIDVLTIYRKVSQATDYSLVTSYFARPFPGQQEIIKNFTSQTWNVSATGAGTGAGNQNTMKLVLNINDVVCTDAGMYRCVVRYSTSTALKDMPAQDQNVTVLSAPQKIVFYVQRYPPYGPFDPDNNGAENYTLTCSIQGPQSVTLQWRSMSANENLDYPVNSGFTTDSPVLIPGSSCQEYTQKTTLTIQNTNLMYDTMYICVASFQGQEVGRDNYTVPALTASSPNSIVSTNIVRTFSVSCDASRVSIKENNIRGLEYLHISRKVPLSQDFSLIASYRYLKYPGLQQSYEYIPQGRNWTITFTGANGGVNNKNTMKLTLNINDAQCVDFGIYQCLVGYFYGDGLENNIATSQPVDGGSLCGCSP